MLVAADLQRPNAVNQLQVNGERAGVTVSRPSPATASATRSRSPAASIEEARRTLHDVVIVDTAGRLGIDAELMQQAADIRDAVEPDEMLFVVDAMIGQDAVNTAQAFLDGVGFDGVVLTKLDGDARGGAALSVATMTGKPVMFASNGEKLTDFDLFHPDRMASRILDMGDMLTLIEQAEKTFDADQAAKAAAKLQGGRRVHPRRLPRADAAGPQDGLADQDARDAARHGPVPRPARELRRARDRPDPGDHPVDDAGRAGQPEDDRRLAPGADREGLRASGLRRQPARRPVLRGAQDDAADGARRRTPGCRACRAWAWARRPRGARLPQPKQAKGKRARATRPSVPRRQAAAAEKPAAASRVGRSGSARTKGVPDDFDPSQLPDLSKYLK